MLIAVTQSWADSAPYRTDVLGVVTPAEAETVMESAELKHDPEYGITGEVGTILSFSENGLVPVEL